MTAFPDGVAFDASTTAATIVATAATLGLLAKPSDQDTLWFGDSDLKYHDVRARPYMLASGSVSLTSNTLIDLLLSANLGTITARNRVKLVQTTPGKVFVPTCFGAPMLSVHWTATSVTASLITFVVRKASGATQIFSRWPTGDRDAGTDAGGFTMDLTMDTNLLRTFSIDNSSVQNSSLELLAYSTGDTIALTYQVAIVTLPCALSTG